MRKLKLQMQITLDGFSSGLNDEMDWMTLNWDDQLNDFVSNLTTPIDCIVMGRKLAEGFIPHWAANPEQESIEAAEKMNNTPKLVFTKTMEHSPWRNAVLAKGNLREEINNLKQKAGGDIIVYGGISFVAALLKENLIDDLYLFVNPVIIGHGRSIFNQITNKQELTLKQSIGFPCGISLLRYSLKNNF